MSSQIWFITGASSGFGLAMVEHVLALGGVAIAIVRNPAKMPSELTAKFPASRMLVIKADVAKPDEITSAFAMARKEFQRIDVVFNNAAISFLSEVETTPIDRARELFDANFWGAAHVSNEAVKFFRDVNQPRGGRLVINSSGVRLLISPLTRTGIYTASKYALEGLTEVLTAELKPEWAIKVTIIEPGYFKTPGAAMPVLPIPPAYKGGLTDHIRAAAAGGPTWIEDDVAKGARSIYDIANDPTASARIPTGMASLNAAKKHIAQLEEQFTGVEKWSKDLTFD